MRCILTKFIPDTNHRERRVKAWVANTKIIVDWNSALSIEGNHRRAASAG